MKKLFCKRGHPRTPDNVNKYGDCRTCARNRNREWLKRHEEYDKNRGCVYREKYPEKVRASKRKSQYKISVEETIKKLAQQNNRCLICFKEISLETLNIDYDHKCCPETPTCGKCTRGLLCTRCNILLGFFETFGFSISEYLRLWQC